VIPTDPTSIDRIHVLRFSVPLVPRSGLCNSPKSAAAFATGSRSAQSLFCADTHEIEEA
jgi:hypothetical protein